MNVMDPLQEVSSTMTEENEVFIEIEVGQPHNGISLAEAANALITLQVPSKESSQHLLPVSSSENGKKEPEKTESPIAEVNPKDFRKKILEGMKSQFNTSTEDDTAATIEPSNRRGPPRSKSKFKRGNLDEDDPAEEISVKTEPSTRVPRGRGRPPKSAQVEVPKPVTNDAKVDVDGAKPERDSSSEAGSEKSDSAAGNGSSGTTVTTRRSQRTNISRTSATELLKGFTERQIAKKRPSSAQDMLKPTDVPRKRGRPARNSLASAERENNEPLDNNVETKSNSPVNNTRVVAGESTPEVGVETKDVPEVKLTSCLATTCEQQILAIEPVTVVDEVLKVEHMASLGLQSRSNAKELSKTETIKKKVKSQKAIVPRNILGARKALKRATIDNEAIKEILDKDAADSTLDISGSTLDQSSSSEEPSTASNSEQEIEAEADKEQSDSLENEIEMSLVEVQPPKESSSTTVAKKVNGYHDDSEKQAHYSCACVELRPPIAVAPPAATLYCQAVDSVGGKLVGCCLIANRKRFHRPSRKIPFMILCDSHRDRIRKHFCCPGCGLFCTQGTFLQCQGVEGSLHFFHAQCQRPGQKSTCLHCNRDDRISEIRLQMKTCAIPVFCNDAKLLKTMPTAKISLIPRESLESSSPSSSMSPSPCPSYLASQLVLPSGKVINSNGIPKSLNRDMLERILKSLDTKSKGSSSSKNLYSACKNGDIERVIECLRSGQNVNTVYSESGGQTPLHAACHGGHLAIVHIIVQSGASLDRMDSSQKTALAVAVVQGHNEIAKYLIQVGASTSIKGEGGMTALHVAAKHGNLEACHYIMTLGQGTTFINSQDDGGWTPLVWGCEHQRLHIVKYLLQCKADPSIRDAEQNVALHWAAYSGSVDIVALLLDSGCQVNAANVHGDTPLHTAGRRDNYECVLLLVTRGSRLDLRNKDDQLALDVCPDKQCHSALLLALNTKLQQLTQMPSGSRVEKLLLNDITKGKESSPIQCVNGCDDEPPPDDYVYITENCFTSPLHVERSINSLQYCRCTGDCSSQSCKCSDLSFRCWYDDEGKLVPEFNYADPPMLFECNRACQCHRTTCNNRLVQHGITARLVLFRVDQKGWGVRTSQPIAKGSYVCEYIGEIISDFEADQREDDSYLFDLDNKDGETYCIDARRYGNIARFINHSCDPNLIPVKVYIDHQDLKFPRIAFFAARDININEELSFDYGDKFWIIKYKSFTCSCFSAKCKYSQLTIHRTVEEYRKCLQEGIYTS